MEASCGYSVPGRFLNVSTLPADEQNGTRILWTLKTPVNIDLRVVSHMYFKAKVCSGAWMPGASQRVHDVDAVKGFNGV